MLPTHYGKRLRTNSFGASVATMESRAPTPPPHKTVFLPSPLSEATDSRSTTSTEPSRGSVIRHHSDRPRILRYPTSSTTDSTFSSSQTSSLPLDFSCLESSGHSWSPSSSSFHTGSSITFNDDASSKRPRYVGSSEPNRGSYQRDSGNSQALVADQASSPGVQACTTLPPVPGYGPIRVTVALDLPHPTSSYFSYNPSSGPTPMATPSSETPPAVLPHGELETALDFLSSSEIRQLLRLAVRKHPAFGDEVRQEYTLKAQAERSKVINFVQYSNNTWHTLNTKYNFMDGEKQHDVASQAVEDVNNDINAILAEVKRESSVGTKKSALETLRKIGRSICLSTGIIGDKVKEWIGYDVKFVDAMSDILGLMTEAEKIEVRDANEGEILKRLEQLDELRSYYGVFDKLDEVVKSLKGGAAHQDSEVEVDSSAFSNFS